MQTACVHQPYPNFAHLNHRTRIADDVSRNCVNGINLILEIKSAFVNMIVEMRLLYS